MIPQLPKIHLIDDQFTRYPGRYMQQESIQSRWRICEADGSVLRELNGAENRLVCSAYQPEAVNHVLRFDLGRASHRVLQVERSNRELTDALNHATSELADRDARIAMLEALISANKLPKGNEAMAE